MVIRLEQFKKRKTSGETIPSWAISETSKKLYHACMETFSKIEAEISSGKQLAINERQIIARRLALACDVSPSIINKRRQPELVNLLADLNSQLEITHASSQAKRHASGRKLTKQELVRENKSLKDEITRLQQLALAESFNQALDNSLVLKSREAAITIQKLREQIIHLETVIDNQAAQYRAGMRPVK